MSADRLIANLLRVGREDLDGARVLTASKNRNAIYLCEQAAEVDLSRHDAPAGNARPSR